MALEFETSDFTEDTQRQFKEVLVSIWYSPSVSMYKLGCPRMTQLLKCYAPDAFSGAKFQVFLENGHEIDVG